MSGGKPRGLRTPALGAALALALHAAALLVPAPAARAAPEVEGTASPAGDAPDPPAAGAATRPTEGAATDPAAEAAAWRQLALGGALLQAGRASEALPLLEQAAAALPQAPEPVIARAGALLALGRPQEALGVIGPLVSQPPTSTALEAAVSLARTAGWKIALGISDAGDHALARRWLDATAQAYGHDRSLRCASAAVALAAGAPDLAWAEATAALQEGPDLWAAGQLVAAARALGRSAEAVALLDQLSLQAPGTTPTAEGPLAKLRAEAAADAAAQATALAAARLAAGPAGALRAGTLRRGLPGDQGDLQAVISRAEVELPWGPARLGLVAEHAVLWDPLDEDQGLSATLGLSSPHGRPLSGAAAVGVSPVGFLGGAYPTFGFRGRWRPSEASALAVELARSPRTDTRAAWAGQLYAPTGQRVGRVSQLWGGLEASVGREPLDAGALVRLGWIEGIGVEPTPTREAVSWVGLRGAAGPVDGRAGLEGLHMHAAADRMAVAPGSGGVYSPDQLWAALARLELRATRGPLGACATGGLGPRAERPTAATTWRRSTLWTGQLGLRWSLPGAWAIALDARGDRASTDWRQRTLSLHLGWAEPAAVLDRPRPPATPGAPLPGAAALCSPHGDAS